MKLSKKHIVMILSVFLFIISVVYRVLNPFVQPTVDKLTFTGVKQGKIVGKVIKNPVSENTIEEKNIVSMFLNKPKLSLKIYKDLFLIYKPPSKVVKKNNVTVPVDNTTQVRQTKDEIKKQSIQQVKDYISSYSVLGMYKSKDTNAVFLSKNKLVLVAKIGDRLDGKYLIDDIQDNYIKIRALDLNETIHLDMREFNNEEL